MSWGEGDMARGRGGGRDGACVAQAHSMGMARSQHGYGPLIVSDLLIAYHAAACGTSPRPGLCILECSQYRPPHTRTHLSRHGGTVVASQGLPDVVVRHDDAAVGGVDHAVDVVGPHLQEVNRELGEGLPRHHLVCRSHRRPHPGVQERVRA